MGIIKQKLHRETRHAEAAAPAADAACVNKNAERDAADRRHRRAAEVDAVCVSRASEMSF